MAKIEVDLSEELEDRLKKVADANAVSLPEMAKYILVHQLSEQREIDWGELISKGRQILRRLIS